MTEFDHLWIKLWIYGLFPLSFFLILHSWSEIRKSNKRLKSLLSDAEDDLKELKELKEKANSIIKGNEQA